MGSWSTTKIHTPPAPLFRYGKLLWSYKSSFERAFDRMLTQYDRAERMHKGQPLAPQVDVKIS